jgi:hypothetical protein
MAKLTAQKILQMLNSETPKERLKAVKIIEKTKNEKLANLCAQKLSSEKVVQIIIAIIELLGKTNKQKYSSIISKLSHSSNSSIAEAAQKYKIEQNVVDTNTISFDDLLLDDDVEPAVLETPNEQKKSAPSENKGKNAAPKTTVDRLSDSSSTNTIEDIIDQFELYEEDLVEDEKDFFDPIDTFSDNPLIDSLWIEQQKSSKKKKRGSGSFLKKFIVFLIFISLIAGGGAYYYFKIYKKTTVSSSKPSSRSKKSSTRKPRTRKKAVKKGS